MCEKGRGIYFLGISSNHEIGGITLGINQRFPHQTNLDPQDFISLFVVVAGTINYLV